MGLCTKGRLLALPQNIRQGWITDSDKHSCQYDFIGLESREVLIGLHTMGRLLALPTNMRQGWITDSDKHSKQILYDLGWSLNKSS
jgi:hypothetical protein